MAAKGIDRVTQILATAVGLAHTTLFFMFAWRAGTEFSMLRVIWAAVAAVGFGVNFLGWSLVKHGGKTRIRKYGRWAIAIATALAGFLLFIAS